MHYHKMKVCPQSGLYLMESTVLSEADILTMANQLSRKRLSKGRSICSPQAVKTYLQNLLQDYEHEVFALLLLDAKHKALALVDVRVLDHIVVGTKGYESLAESGVM